MNANYIAECACMIDAAGSGVPLNPCVNHVVIRKSRCGMVGTLHVDLQLSAACRTPIYPGIGFSVIK
jgi:hypothetical protein